MTAAKMQQHCLHFHLAHVMRHLPDELLEHIIEVSDDEAALVRLSCASRRFRACVASRQTHWHECYARQFPSSDEKELQWLRQYQRMHRLVKAHNRDSTGDAADLRQGLPPSWFETYCRRCAAEYRWRHGKYAVHQLDKTSVTRPEGMHIQSVPLVRKAASLNDALIASQWLMEGQQQPKWTLERLCCDGVDVAGMEIDSYLCSDEYLVAVAAQPREDNAVSRRCVLYSWHFAALSKPPRTLAIDGWIYDIDIHRNWLLGQYITAANSRQAAVVMYDLAEGQRYVRNLDTWSAAHCIQRSTADGVFIIKTDCFPAASPVMVSYQLSELTTSITPALFRRTARRQAMSKGGGNIMLQRINDDCSIMWTYYSGEPSPRGAPNLALIETCNSADSVSLGIRWSRLVAMWTVVPIPSCSLLAVDCIDGAKMLLRVDDGSTVHNIAALELDCWTYSGLYPLEYQLARMPKDTTWKDPRNDATLCLSSNAREASSPSATLYNGCSTFIVIDYSVYPRQLK
ncbi:hypothetical protein THASP1DRAFT_32621 [Thamnocephalis sphaerospora]|uniref:F-box domain-containing protein n=1 Tax=Thamnocephalis sphaerospora TaxID=78915 RepID=A0A4V1IVX1_9FUNG|nr:hypothetical protein THASP1DRAFT_32621 [Thamnocephalis sphaerospora]|eukprot:RKP05539.1 hypothetical protein THASP1DRAFT_32621 [Thamnocephalis sphaerospora]